MAASKGAPKNLHIGEELGADRTLYLRWTWSEPHTDHYEIRWEYTTGNYSGYKNVVDPKTKKKKKVGIPIWFTGSETSVNSGGQGITTYSYSANAKQVRAKIRAVAQQKENNSAYWSGSWSAWVDFTVPSTTGIAADQTITNHVADYVVEPEKGSTDSTVHARWRWTKAYTDYFDVKWYYTDGTSVDVEVTDPKTKKTKTEQKSLWYLGTIEEVAYEPDGPPLGYYTSTYNIPSTATRIQSRVTPVSKVKEETETVVRYHFIAPYNDKPFRVKPELTKYSDKPSVRITIQNGSSRDLIAQWTWTKTTADHYDYRWEYTTGEKTNDKAKSDIYFPGDSGSTTKTYSTYSLPDNAIRARFVVTPIGKTNAFGYVSWTAKDSGYVYSPLTTPTVDTVSGLKLSRDVASESSFTASWKWSQSNTDHFEVSWFYKTGTKDSSGNEILYSATTESTTNTFASYSPPANARAIIVKVLPIAKAGSWFAKLADTFYTITMPADLKVSSRKAVTDVNIYAQTGVSKTLFGQWTWDSDIITQVDHFDVQWNHLVNVSGVTPSAKGTTVWVQGGIKSVDGGNGLVTSFVDSYTVPDNAAKVCFKVKPISKTKKVQGIDTAYWTASWSEWIFYEVSELEAATTSPPVPQTPSVLMEGLTLIASVNIYDSGADIIEFNVVKDESESYDTALSRVTYNHAEVRIPVAIGGKYKVQARSLRIVKGYTADDVLSGASPASSERGDWSEYSDNVGTMPATPERIESHIVESSTSVYLKWSSVLNVTGYKIEYAIDPEYFDGSSQVQSISTGTESFYYVSGLESGKQYFFRVCAVNNDGQSGWTPIYSLKLGIRPNPPTTWSDTTRGTIGEDIYLYWTHNSEDSSTQRDAEIELIIDKNTEIVKPTYPGGEGAPGFYIFNSIFVEEHELLDDSGNAITDSESDSIKAASISTYPEGCTVLWRVRTLGLLDEWSDWSAQRTIEIYSDPTLSLYVGSEEDHNDRTYEITQYPIYIHAEAFPKTQKAISYTVSIISNETYETIDRVGDASAVMDQQSVFDKYYSATDENVLDVVLSANDVNLDNGISYTVKVTVAMDSGLTGVNDWTFTVRWDETELEPEAEVTINRKALCAYIRPYCKSENGDYLINVFLSVYRIEYDGRFVLIAENLPNGDTTIVDPHPSLNYARYRVVANSANTGAIGFNDIPGAFVGETAIVLQWNEAWRSFDSYEDVGEEYDEPVYAGSTLKLPYNIEISDSNDLDVALNEYVGRAHPVSYYGTQLGVKGSWNAVIPRNDIETLYALRRLAIYRGDVYVREPSGVGYWANVSVSFSRKYSEMTIPVSLNVTRVEGGI